MQFCGSDLCPQKCKNWTEKKEERRKLAPDLKERFSHARQAAREGVRGHLQGDMPAMTNLLRAQRKSQSCCLHFIVFSWFIQGETLRNLVTEIHLCLQITSEDTSRCMAWGGGTCRVPLSAPGQRSKITVINGIFGDICIARLGGRDGRAGRRRTRSWFGRVEYRVMQTNPTCLNIPSILLPMHIQSSWRELPSRNLAGTFYCTTLLGVGAWHASGGARQTDTESSGSRQPTHAHRTQLQRPFLGKSVGQKFAGSWSRERSLIYILHNPHCAQSDNAS